MVSLDNNNVIIYNTYAFIMPQKKRIKIRRKWRINPRTKVKKSDKIYRRPRAKAKLRKLIKLRRENEAKIRNTQGEFAGGHDPAF